ncbi:formate dehydrogenase subunit delta [Pseudolabrys sp. FHR47]|uniref:formate dehydrogenase subunit delta n=1 Tax=Pseudolabrys sp. FHR47 TaxID=2562284 RepID=UPI0010BEDFAF|nr:formate dehydrogenase subunit delta [Pseudolabrys sp. FHR47]
MSSQGKGADKLVYMANQIGTFFKSQGEEAAVLGTAEHIRKFWDPRMRSAIFAHLDAGGEGLQPAVRKAIMSLKAAATPTPKAS